MQRACVETLADRLADTTDVRQHTRLRADILHARHLFAGVDTGSSVRLGLSVAQYDYAAGRFGSAVATEQVAVERSRRILGEEHPDTLTSMNNLANTLGSLGDLAGARALQEQVLARAYPQWRRRRPVAAG